MDHKAATANRTFLLVFVLLAVLLLAGCAGTSASEPQMVTIGILNSADVFALNIDGFKDGMKDLGYVEGENVTYIYPGPIGDPDERAAYVQSLVDQGVDVIFTNGTSSSISAATTTSSMPIVFAPVAFPVDAGLIDSLSHPGGNVTGISNGASHSRRLQTLVELVPDVKRVYIPIDPNAAVSQLVLVDVQAAADQLGLELVIDEFTDEAEMDVAIADFPDDVDAIFMLPGDWVGDTLPKWLEVSFEHNLPMSSDGSPEAGALFTLDADDYQVGYQAARLAVDILKGANPGDLPVESPEFFLTLNLKTADAIGLTISDEILARVDNVIR